MVKVLGAVLNFLMKLFRKALAQLLPNRDARLLDATLYICGVYARQEPRLLHELLATNLCEEDLEHLLYVVIPRQRNALYREDYFVSLNRLAIILRQRLQH
jgi:hypothetical protein